MGPFFLLSEATEGYGRELLRSVTDSSCPVIAFVKNIEQLGTLRDDFTSVIWIVLDVNRNVDTVVKFLKVIPCPNYIVNFSGQRFAEASSDVQRQSGNVYKERERGRNELTLDGIVNDEDGDECRIFVNVVEKRPKSKTVTKKFGKLVKGAKKKLSTLANDDDSGTEENEPLIQRPTVEESPPQGFLSFLLSLCCPCFSKPPEQEYSFQNPQELRMIIRSEHLDAIFKSLRNQQENAILKWGTSLEELRKKETQKIEALVASINDKREAEEQELTTIKERQNRNTKENLSSVLSPDIIKKIEESRSRQTKGTVHYDADRAFKEGQYLISKQVIIDKAQLQERCYFQLVEKQLEKLGELNVQYRNKQQDLQRRYFRNAT
ncbi:hypothetical protein Ocin01_10235 [Orchesella cincta]|uniref:Uncharacterized protein n=1 Tax=Orchesella cincta TaxID=48709 RepID=A0A1D2MTS3_ORCCI|nr:hypothetical protein Ocin01_10235 [Orchesella cincta]